MSFQQWAQIVGASIVGGLIATLSQFGLEWWRVRRERRYRHFDELTEVYHRIFVITHRLRELSMSFHPAGRWRHDKIEREPLDVQIGAIREELRELLPRMDIGMPQRTKAAVEDLMRSVWPVHHAVRERATPAGDISASFLLMHRASQLLDFHARWDLGHVDEPPPWTWTDHRFLRRLPLKVKGVYVRRFMSFDPARLPPEEELE